MVVLARFGCKLHYVGTSRGLTDAAGLSERFIAQDHGRLTHEICHHGQQINVTIAEGKILQYDKAVDSYTKAVEVSPEQSLSIARYIPGQSVLTRKVIQH